MSSRVKRTTEYELKLTEEGYPVLNLTYLHQTGGLIYMDVAPSFIEEDYKDKTGRYFFYPNEKIGDINIRADDLEKILAPELFKALAEDRDNLPSEIKHRIFGLPKIAPTKVFIPHSQL